MKEKKKIDSVLGADVEFEGKLKFSGSLKIDGHVRGEILGEGSLLVGERAVIQADIHTFSVRISGEVRGNIFADHRIEIPAPGKVFGDIQAPVVVMREGATLRGRVGMRAEDEEHESGSDMSAAGGDPDSPAPSLGAPQGNVMECPSQADDNT